MYIMGTVCPKSAINSFNNTKWKLKINILPNTAKKKQQLINRSKTGQKHLHNMHETKHSVPKKSIALDYKILSSIHIFLSVV